MRARLHDQGGLDFGVIRAVDEFCSSHALTLETDANFTWFARLMSRPA